MSWESSVYKSWTLKEPEGSKYAEETWKLYCNQRRKEKHSSLPKQSQLHRGSERKSMMKIEESCDFYNRKTQWQINWYIVFFVCLFFCCSLKKEWWKHNPLPLPPLQEAWLGFFFFPLSCQISGLLYSGHLSGCEGFAGGRGQNPAPKQSYFRGSRTSEEIVQDGIKAAARFSESAVLRMWWRTPRAAALFSRRRNGRHTDHWG